MNIGIATYRTLSVLILVTLVVAVAFASTGRMAEAAIAFGVLVAAVLAQAVLLRCHHCGTRPGLWLLAIWTILFSPELYIADALFLRKCPKCNKSLSEAKAAGG
jgi:uncharacterized membrane protein